VLGVGAVIAGYRVERVLGVGGMGAVYLVANPELPRRDALKVLSAGLSSDDSFRARFIREADVASQLDHPNIVSIYRRGTTADGQLWIAMQFVDGANADQAMRAGQMNPQRAVRIVGDVGRALDYARRRGVIHRDVKPANILLTGGDGDEERALLGDFGIARALDDVGLTGTAGVMATVSYAAPEVIAGGQVDGRADLYSLGCTLFRLLTGRSPFEGTGSQASVIMAHLQSPPPRITAVAPWLPPALDAVLIKALAKDPAQRYASGVELAAAADAALRSGAPLAPPVRPAGPVWAPPHPAAPPQPQRQQFAGAPAFPGPPGSPRPGRIRTVALALTGVLVAIAAVIGVLLVARESGHSGATAQDSTTTPPGNPAVSTGPTSASSTPGSVAPAGAVPVSALSDLLLSPAELSSAIGVPPMTVVNDEHSMWNDTIVDKDCDSVVMVNGQADYAGSGYTAIRWQALKDNPGDWRWDVGQTVVSFPRADDASSYVAHAAEIWKKCANRTVNTRAAKDTDAPDTMWTIGPVADADGIVSTTRVPQGATNGMCQEGLSSRDNVVIRVWVCQLDGGSMVVRDFVGAIAEKVSAHS